MANSTPDRPQRLPDVSEVTGAFLGSDEDYVSLQYRGNAGELYKIRFPLDQILKSEEWFIPIRRHVGGSSSPERDFR